MSSAISTRLLAFAFVAAFVAACGGGTDNTSTSGGAPLPQNQHAGLMLETVMFSNGARGIANSGDTYNVQSTITSVGPGGVIDVAVTVHWSNSAGGSGDISPQGVNCNLGICQSLAWFVDIPLQTGTNNIVITATAPGGSPETVTLTVIRQ